MNCKNNSSCCSPYSILAQQLEETTDRAIQAYNLAVQGLRNPVNENLTINGDLLVNGDLFQYGAAYETHAEKVYTNDDYIVMRDGAVSGLAAGDYSGFQVTKYDGVNDGRLVIDKDGTARVGDVNDEQPLATRDESADLTDGHLVKWDAANLKLIDSGIPADEAGLELYDEGSYTPGTLTPYSSYSIGIPMSADKSFETGYDYLVSVSCALDFGMNIKSTREMETPGNSSIPLQMQAGDMTNPTLDYAVYRFGNGGNSPAVNVIGMCGVKLQPKLVSGTNIKTVGGQSLLGSGDVPAGGLTWTKRTANDNWTDMIVYESGEMKILKHVYIFDPSGKFSPVYLPKGYRSSSVAINIGVSSNKWVSNNVINVGTYFTIHNNNLTAVTLTEYYIPYTFTTDGSNVTITKGSSSNTPSVLKSTLVVYTAD